MPINSADPAHTLAPGGTADTTAIAGRALAARFTRRGALALAPVIALAAGCSSSKDKSNTGGSTGGSGALDKVNYMTGFGSFGREAYAWVADSKGYFRDNGLDVKILPGSGQPSEVAGLATGKTDFYCVEASLTISLLAKGQKDVKIVGAIHQRTVVALMALAKNKITRPQDLVGKKIAYGGQAPNLLFPAYAKLAGFDPHVTWETCTPQQLPAWLATGKADVIGQFVTGAPLIKATAKQDISILPYGDYLGDLPGNLLLTNSKMLNEKSDITHRFIDALMKGLDYTIKNPDEAGQILAKAVPGTKAEVAALEVQAMKPYVTTNGSPVGSLTPDGMTKTLALLTSIGVVPQGALTADGITDFNFVPKAA